MTWNQINIEKFFKKPILRLLEQGHKVGHQGEYGITGLHMASLHNHPQVVSCLLDNGAAPDVKDAWGWGLDRV